MNPAILAGLVQGGGSLLGGLGRRKASKAAEKVAEGTALDAVNTAANDENMRQKLVGQDRKDLAALIKRDEARLRANSGYDLVKLRDQAVKAGFNPLTVLNATGGAGYDSRGAVLTTPFLARSERFEGLADDFWRRADLITQAYGASVSTAGYFGDAISAGGSAYFGQRQQEAQNALERERIDILRQEAASRPAQSVSNGSPFSDAPVRREDVAYREFIGPRQPVEVWTPNGWIAVPAGVAERLGLESGQSVIGEDWTRWKGEIMGEGFAGTDAITDMRTDAPPVTLPPGGNPVSWLNMGVQRVIGGGGGTFTQNLGDLVFW